MPRASRGVLLAVTMALLLAGPLVAQSNTGNVYGNVIDEQGGTIPGGTATLIGPSAPMTTSVDAQGLFRFLKVPPGKYAVTVVMPGFTTVTRENVIVSVGKNTQVDVQLKLSTVQEAVTVTSATPLIDTRKVETGQNFSHDELDRRFRPRATSGRSSSRCRACSSTPSTSPATRVRALAVRTSSPRGPATSPI